MAEEAPAASAMVSRRMAAQKTRDTAPELALRRELHSRGLRYRLDTRPLAELRRRCDIVFAGPKVAVNVHGCFWHGCPEHMTWPKNNAEWWRSKIDRNKTRDTETANALTRAGWLYLVVWEHDDIHRAASMVQAAIRARQLSAS